MRESSKKDDPRALYRIEEAIYVLSVAVGGTLFFLFGSLRNPDIGTIAAAFLIAMITLRAYFKFEWGGRE